MAEDHSTAAWRRWWDAQYDLRGDVDKRIEQAGAGRSDQFRAALVAALIEYLAEKQREYLHLPASDARTGYQGESTP